MTRFQDQLASQLGFLARSAKSYDEGFVDEGIRMATVIRTLIHQTNRSTALLTHLGNPAVALLSTCAQMSPRTLAFEMIAAQTLSSDGTASIKPNLGATGYRKFLPVAEWWNQEVAIPYTGRRVTRKEIVLDAANRDGGAHVDAKLSADYVALSSGRGPFVWYDSDGNETARWQPSGIQLVYLRQFAYELLESPELLHLTQAVEADPPIA